jgi:hypothetical protein
MDVWISLLKKWKQDLLSVAGRGLQGVRCGEWEGEGERARGREGERGRPKREGENEAIKICIFGSLVAKTCYYENNYYSQRAYRLSIGI